jgi:TrmH family RNA methyltransferase
VVEQVASTVHPQPALAVARPRLQPLDAALGTQRDPLVLVLCDVADPGNAGTLLRVAEAAGATCVVVCGPASVDVHNPKVVRAASGSLFRLGVVVTDDAAAVLDELAARGLQRVATVVEGGAPYERVDYRGPTALVLGSEAHGLPPELLASMDVMVTIPMHGHVESLNVGVAGAVLAFEAARQRRAGIGT